MSCFVEGCKALTVRYRTDAGPCCNSHYLMMQRGGTVERICKECNNSFVYISREDHSGNRCLPCTKLWRNMKEKAYTCKSHGLTLHNYFEIYNAQNGKCKLCSFESDNLVLDHDHKCCAPFDILRGGGKGRSSCGKCIRGLLCHNCNLIVGNYEKCKGDLSLVEIDKYLSDSYFIFGG